MLVVIERNKYSGGFNVCYRKRKGKYWHTMNENLPLESAWDVALIVTHTAREYDSETCLLGHESLTDSERREYSLDCITENDMTHNFENYYNKRYAK